MNRTRALPYVSYAVDNALSPRDPKDAPANAVLVGWQCGFEPLFVAVWSYLQDTQGNASTLDADEAVELATDLLQERKWFSDNENPPEPDYVIGGRE